MNIVKELRRKKGVQQKELAIEIGVSQPTVSDWEANKKDPSGERLKRLAEYFGVDELVILGYGQRPPFTPLDPELSGISETEQIVNYVLDRLNIKAEPQEIKTPEARLLAKGVDKMKKEQREALLTMMQGLYPGLFVKGTETNDT